MKLKAVCCFAFLLLCATTASLPANAQVDVACSGLSHILIVNWPQPGFTPCGTRSNPNEFILSPTTVKNLQMKWHNLLGDSGGGGVSPAVVNGVLYVDAYYYSGIAHAVDYLYALDANTGAQLWRQARGTQSPSSPAVANGMVFIGDLDTNVYAFNADTGAPVWKFTTGERIWSSPTVANAIVYMISGDGNMYALDAATGTQLWVKAVFRFGQFFTGNPAVARGVVYVPAGTADASLYALVADTGVPLWSVKTGNSMVTGSPAVENGVVYAGMDDGFLYALDALTGAVHWKSPALGPGMTGVAVGNGLVYVGSTDGNYNGSLNCINASTGGLVWKVSMGVVGTISPSPIFANGIVYVPGGPGGAGLTALDGQTGAVLWQNESYNGGYPVVVNGVLYANGEHVEAYDLPSQ